MSYLVANIPSVEVWVDKRFLYDFQTDSKGKHLGEGEWERGHWVSAKSIPNRALQFETYIDKFGAVYDKLPIHAFRWRLPEDGDKTYPLDFAVAYLLAFQSFDFRNSEILLVVE